MRYLTLCERDTVGVGQRRPLSEHEADGIAKLADRMPKGSLAWERRALRFGPFCGVLRTSELTIELLPKIERGASTPAGSRGLLVAMLASTGRLRFSRIGDADLGRQNLHLLDIFIQDFCERVKSALRGGAIATYIATDANLNAIRGRLRLTEHLARNAFDRSRLLCRFDERTVDNAFNRALKHVLRALLSHALAPSTRAGVTSLLHRLHEVTDQRVRPSDLDALRFDRTNDCWRNAFHTNTGKFPGTRKIFGSIESSPDVSHANSPQLRAPSVRIRFGELVKSDQTAPTFSLTASAVSKTWLAKWRDFRNWNTVSTGFSSGL